jgi:hypothetical protein
MHETVLIRWGTLTVVSARVLSAAVGLFSFAIAASLLPPAVFLEAAFFQACTFLLAFAGDYGIVSLGQRRIAINREAVPHWADVQGLRFVAQGVLAIFWGIAFLFLDIRYNDPAIPVLVAAVHLSVPLQVDYLYYGTGRESCWARKAVVVSVVQASANLGLIAVFPVASTVLAGQVLGNTAAAFVSRYQGINPRPSGFKFSHAEYWEMTRYSAAGVFAHLGHNFPLIAGGAGVPSSAAVAFAPLYRLFASAVLLVPTVMEFVSSRLIAKRSAYPEFRELPRSTLKELLAAGGLAASPILLFPADVLFSALNGMFKLTKFSVSAGDLIYVKVAVAMYVVDSAASKWAYVRGASRSMLIASASAMLVSLSVYLVAWASSVTFDLQFWFSLLYVYLFLSPFFLFVLTLLGSRT